MHLHDLIERELLAAAISDGYVNVNEREGLRIFNYSASAQYERAWNEATVNCRGLIVDSNDEILARPFPKFFNYTEVRLPNFALGSPPMATEKLDGSLGVGYVHNGTFKIATRGSFTSDQALWASRWVAETHPEFRPPPGITPLFEIIYPANRIVCDYKGLEALILVAAIDTTTGADVPLWEVDWWPGLVVDIHHGVDNIDEEYRLATSDDKSSYEGIVLCWYRPGAPSFRLKMKNPEYLRLHKLIFGLSTKSIWEALVAGQSISHILEELPDEFYGWARKVHEELIAQHRDQRQRAHEAFADVCSRVGTESRKKFALAAKEHELSWLLFALLDGRDIDEMIWRRLQPEFSRPILDDEE
jgi:RNA ligase